MAFSHHRRASAVALASFLMTGCLLGCSDVSEATGATPAATERDASSRRSVVLDASEPGTAPQEKEKKPPAPPEPVDELSAALKKLDVTLSGDKAKDQAACLARLTVLKKRQDALFERYKVIAAAKTPDPTQLAALNKDQAALEETIALEQTVLTAVRSQKKAGQ